MVHFQKVGDVIETGANLLSYGKAESDIHAQLLALGWTEAEVTQLLRGMRWRLRTPVISADIDEVVNSHKRAE